MVVCRCFLLFQTEVLSGSIFGFSGALFPRELGMAGNDVDIWPPPQELKSTLNAWPKVRKLAAQTRLNVLKPWLF